MKKIILLTSIFLLFSFNCVFAEDTSLFATSDTNNQVISIISVDRKTVNKNSFTKNNILMNSFSTKKDILEKESNITNEKPLSEDATIEIQQISSIIKQEIKRQEDEKKQLEEKLKKEKEEQEKKKREQSQKSKTNSTVRTIRNTEGNSPDNDGSTLSEILTAQLGKPYVYGGNGPNSFDCSGLVKYVYNKIGISLPRVAADQQAVGTSVERNIDTLKYGDLVFFASPGSTYATHVGVYVGNGYMIHAPQTGDVVKYTYIFDGYYKNRFFSAKRVL